MNKVGVYETDLTTHVTPQTESNESNNNLQSEHQNHSYASKMLFYLWIASVIIVIIAFVVGLGVHLVREGEEGLILMKVATKLYIVLCIFTLVGLFAHCVYSNLHERSL